MEKPVKDLMYYKFCAYGFIKNLQFFDPFLLLFFLENGLDFLQIGLLFSVREIGINIMEIPSGVLADLLGRRKSMVFSFASYIVSYLVFFFFPSFLPSIAAMVLFASGEAFRTGTHKAMILEHLKLKGLTHQKVMYYGNTRSWSQMGSSLSALIAAVLVFYSGSYRIVFLISTIPYVIDMLLIISYPAYLEGTRNDMKACEDTDESESTEKERCRPGFFQEIVSMTGSFMKLFTRPEARKALLTSSFFDGLFKSVKDYIQPMILAAVITLPLMKNQTDIQRVAVLSGIVYFILYQLTAMASLQSGRVRNDEKVLTRFLDFTFILGSLAVLAAGILLRFHLSLLSIILFIVYYMLMNVRRPVSLSYFSDKVPDEIMATGLSVESQMKTVILAVLAPVMGFLADRFGVSIALMILAAAGMILYPFVRTAVKSDRK